MIPNERLKMISQEKITLMNAFQAADNVLRQGVESISALINVPAFINLDFADVRSIMKDAGYAHMGVEMCIRDRKYTRRNGAVCPRTVQH